MAWRMMNIVRLPVNEVENFFTADLLSVFVGRVSELEERYPRVFRGERAFLEKKLCNWSECPEIEDVPIELLETGQFDKCIMGKVRISSLRCNPEYTLIERPGGAIGDVSDICQFIGGFWLGGFYR